MSDSDALSALFGGPLVPDPAVGLDASRISLPKAVPGPIHGAQYIIEIAGPRSIPAAQARELLGPRWNGALGGPEIYVMSSADEHWRLMSTSDGSGSYDSLALAWDMLSVRGALSPASAKVLLQTAEAFASTIGRRAFPFPPPDEIRSAATLRQAQESFDIGVELIVQGAQPIPESAIWRVCSAMGFDLAPDGVFVWRAPGWDLPLLTVAPLEEGVAYSLRSVQQGLDHEAVGVGFSVPVSPDPMACLEALFHSAKVLASHLNCTVLTDEGYTLDPAIEAQMRSQIKMAVDSMRANGLVPGSRTALKLFE